MIFKKKTYSYLIFFMFVFCQPAWTHVHVAREFETLDRLALKYYGHVKYSMIIRAANGFIHPDDGSLTDGERIEIPQVIYYKIKNKDSWDLLADRYLGSIHRGSFLAEINDEKYDNPPTEGEIIIIPFQLLHIMAKDESLVDVLKFYHQEKISVDWVKRYNLAEKRKFGRGDVVLIPLADIKILDSQSKKMEGNKDSCGIGHIETQKENAVLIEKLGVTYSSGEYIKTVAVASRILGNELLTMPQKIAVFKILGFAYTALEKNELAQNVFIKALKMEPSLKLSKVTVSPKIIKIFNSAKEKFKNSN